MGDDLLMKGLVEMLVLFGEFFFNCLLVYFLFVCAGSFVSVHSLSLVVGSKGYPLVAVCVAFHCCGFSCLGAWALGTETPEDEAHRP